jgi:PBP1b-binding outer membrane lipoprotein LpoB
MTFRMRALLIASGIAMLSGCSAKPEWDNTQATMDPHERYAQEMKAKQDAAPPIPAAPKVPVASATAAPATAQAPAPKAQ